MVLPAPVGRLRIGRTPDNDLVLADLTVSRYHAELRKSASGHYEIADLGSHNGTFVNGQRISSATLTEKDIVGIGHAAFRLAAVSCANTLIPVTFRWSRRIWSSRSPAARCCWTT